MQNEKDFFDHCNEFVYIHDFDQFFLKIDDDPLEFDVLDSNVYLYLIDYFKFYSFSLTGFSSTIFSNDSIYITFSRTSYISSCIPSNFLS